MIPGSCEEFTRPEEIKALSKFLKQGREALDNSITLNQDNLEVKGRKFIETPNKLPDNLEVLNPGSAQVSSLVSSKEWLDSGKDLDLLENNKELLSVGTELADLSSGKENLEINSEEVNLPKTAETLNGAVSTNVLESLVDKIVNNEVIDSLNTSKLDLQESPKELKSLGSEKESLLGDKIIIERLGKSRLDLDDKRKNTLSENIERLFSDDKIESLEDYKDIISSTKNETLSLGDTKEKLSSGSIKETNSLPSIKEEITSSPKSIELNNHKEVIKGREDENGETNLSDILLKIKDTSSAIELEKDKLLIKDERKVSLPNNTEKLKKTIEDNSLEDTIVKVENDSEVKKLSNQIETLKPNSALDSLGGEKESLTLPETETKLSDTIKILGNIDDGLEHLPEKNEKLTDNAGKGDKLSENLEKLNTPEKQAKLSEVKEKLKDTTEELNSLGTSREDLVGIENTIELENSQLRLKTDSADELNLSSEIDILDDVNRDIELGDTIEKLGKTINVELSEYSEKLSPVEKEILELEDQLESLSIDANTVDLETASVKLSDVGEEVTEITALESEKILSEKEFDNSIDELGTDVEFLDISNSSSTDKLENSRLNLEINQSNELEDYIDSLSDNRENSLENYKDSLLDSRENELEEYIDSIIDTRENKLEDYKDNILDSRENSLLGEDTLISEDNKNSNTWDESLEDHLEKVEDNRENELEDYKENISDPRENSLLGEDTLISEDNKNSNTWDESLEDHLEKVEDNRENELEDHKESIAQINDVDLLEGKKILPKDDTTKDGHRQFDTEDGLYDSVIVSPSDSESEKHKQFDPEDGLGSDRETLLRDTKPKELESLPSEAIQAIDDSENKETTDLKKTISEILATRDDLSLYYTNILKFAQNKQLGNSGWTAKVSSLISAYLSSDKISQEKAKEFEEALYRTIIFEEPVTAKPSTEPGNVEKLENTKESLLLPDQTIEKLPNYSEDVVSYKLPGFNLMGNGLNSSSYLRWVAENTVGRLAKGKLRAVLLDEALGLLIYGRDQLEKLTKSNRDRLPGDDGGVLGNFVTGGLGSAIKGAISGVGGALLGGNSLDMSIPHNRPKDEDDNSTMPQDVNKNTVFEGLNEKGVTTKEEGKSLGKSLLGAAFGVTTKEEGKALGKSLLDAAMGGILGGSSVGSYKFSNGYLKGEGIKTTLNELCVNTDASKISSVEQLYQAIRQSPYIGNSGKVTSYNYDTTKVQTLDSNCYWEIIFTPYVGAENGNMSYLPPINEINVWNLYFHGVYTGITSYVPVNSFELGKAKLTTKTLGLFDGEISYPVSMEFTNELRLTFVDDQYKSWRTYFERCMDVAIYNSTPHFAGRYKEGAWGGITTIDKRYNLGAPYKNITFRCIIYSLTPQMSTVSKYDLLLVMKDFIEERSGEIDGGANDLTVSFSIVGENPKEEIPKVAKLKEPTKKKKKDASRTGTKSIISEGVSSIIGVFS